MKVKRQERISVLSAYVPRYLLLNKVCPASLDSGPLVKVLLFKGNQFVGPEVRRRYVTGINGSSFNSEREDISGLEVQGQLQNLKRDE